MTLPSAPSPSAPFWRSIAVVLVAGCVITAFTNGPRSTMGFFLTPMATDNGWSREVFAFAIAIQNLIWGATLPFAGMIADRYGTARVLTGGAILYVAGLVLMAQSTDPLSLQISAGVLIGAGISGSTFGIVSAAFGRLLPTHLRTIGFGAATAAGSFGQFLFAPLGQGFIQAYGWQTALLLIALFVMVVPVLAIPLRGKSAARTSNGLDQSIPQALGEAFRHRSYLLLVSGFFVCGFQIGFITVHLPSYLNDVGIPVRWGAVALALIGLFNIVGSFSSGIVSSRYPMRYLLSAIYITRAIAIALFVLLPPTVGTVLAFAAVIGFAWLSTVPPTQGLVMVMFGTRYMATLFGFVFFSHQFGSFLAIWIGGRLFDTTGSYDVVWWISVALGVFAALVHLPIAERPVSRIATPA